MRTVFESAPGVQTVIDLASDGTLTTGTVQDCTPIADRMKAMHSEGLHGSSEMKFAGTIPFVLAEKYCNDNGITFTEFSQNREHIRRLINDPVMAHFRVWPGKV